jgi:S1-C subfamily serine protease
MENNKRDYSDFFKPNAENSTEREPENELSQKREDSRAEQSEKPSYYYSYGPFKSAMNEESNRTTAVSSGGGANEPVEISAPRPVRPYYGYAENKEQIKPVQPANGWDFSKAKKKSSFRSVFAAFMAGAVVVASLMFVSDKMNLFGGTGTSNAASPAAANITQTAGGGSGGGGNVTAALDSTVRPGNISQIVSSASPAVVKITTYVKGNKRSNGYFGTDDFFNYFFGYPPRSNQGQNGDQRVQSGMGSGFIFDSEGYILTNQHVIDGADEVEVEVQGYSEPFKAKVLGSEYSLDLAVVKIEPEKGKPFEKLPLGSSDEINVGDWVIAIGNPYGFDHTVTVGVLSAKERPINIRDSQGTREYKHLLQTDASINPGNSGGPLLNLKGEVIGINTAVNAEAQGIGFAIPTSTVVSVLDNLKNNIKIPIPYIGVGIQNIQPAWVEELKLENAEGVLVGSIVSGGPAEKADLQPYDVIIEVNGEKVKDAESFRDKIRSMKVGDKATLTIIRDGKKMTTAVIIGDQNAQ